MAFETLLSHPLAMPPQDHHRGDEPMSSQEATTPPPISSNVRRFTRRRDNKLIAGVCSGLGDYTGMDPVIFRIAFVALVFAGGSGFLLYGLAWLFVPEAGSDKTHAQSLFGRFDATPWLGVALLIAGGALLLTQIGLARPPLIWGSALLILGFVLFREHEPGPRRPPETTSSLAAYAPPRTTSTLGAETTAVIPPAAVAARRPPRERSPLGWYTIAAALLALGSAALLDAADAIDLTLAQYFALPLAVVGAGLIVGAWLGRSRLLIFLGLLLVPFVLVASLIHVPLTGPTGSFVYTPRSPAYGASYHLAAGKLTLDLTHLALRSGSNDVTASVGAGQIRVLVPPRVALDIDGRSGLGAVDVLGRTRAGAGVQVRNLADSSSSRPALSLDLRAGLGLVQVERVLTRSTR
jgi:phage shock protein PspC (stress-responsive transcriptional regulator)